MYGGPGRPRPGGRAGLRRPRQSRQLVVVRRLRPGQPDRGRITNKYDPNYKTRPRRDLRVLRAGAHDDFAIRFEGFYKNRHRYAIDRGILGDDTLETRDNLIPLTDEVHGRDLHRAVGLAHRLLPDQLPGRRAPERRNGQRFYQEQGATSATSRARSS